MKSIDTKAGCTKSCHHDKSGQLQLRLGLRVCWDWATWLANKSKNTKMKRRKKYSIKIYASSSPWYLKGYCEYNRSLHHMKNNIDEYHRKPWMTRCWSNHDKRLGFGETECEFYKNQISTSDVALSQVTTLLGHLPPTCSCSIQEYCNRTV